MHCINDEQLSFKCELWSTQSELVMRKLPSNLSTDTCDKYIDAEG